MSKITSIEAATLTGTRPRTAGSNARLGEHGLHVRVPVVRITTDAGVSGFGWSRATPEQLQLMLAMSIQELISPENGVIEGARHMEYPLWDALGQQLGKPVYQIINPTITDPLRVPCYDTSLYFDDLHLDSNEAAADLIAEEARYGYEQGHRAFKIKVGRGARHMPLEAGTQRDIAIILAVRAAVGADCPIMIDANNGYNLNLSKRVLEATADCDLYWFEEAFHEDRILYEHLRHWMNAQGLSVLIADGEGQASPTLMDWAREGIIDVVQYDIFDIGMTRWLEVARQLDAWGRNSAPHHYGRHLGNYVTGHLAAGIDNFTRIEWDEATTPGIDASAYSIQDGYVHIPDAPGFGLTLDDAVFEQAVDDNGFRLSL